MFFVEMKLLGALDPSKNRATSAFAEESISNEKIGAKTKK
jgi:hypothetical protein